MYAWSIMRKNLGENLCICNMCMSLYVVFVPIQLGLLILGGYSKYHFDGFVVLIFLSKLKGVWSKNAIKLDQELQQYVIPLASKCEWYLGALLLNVSHIYLEIVNLLEHVGGWCLKLSESLFHGRCHGRTKSWDGVIIFHVMIKSPYWLELFHSYTCGKFGKKGDMLRYDSMTPQILVIQLFYCDDCPS